MAPGSSAPQISPASSFYLLPVMVTRGLERDGDSAQFITSMEKPSHLSSWQRDRSCLCIWKGSTPYCFQGPFVFHLLKNQRLKFEEAPPVDTGFVVWYESQGSRAPFTPGSELSAHTRHLTAVSRQVPCEPWSLFQPPASDTPFLRGRAHLPLEDRRAPLPSLPCSFGRIADLDASNWTRPFFFYWSNIA